MSLTTTPQTGRGSDHRPAPVGAQPVRPGSAELSALLARLAEGASRREAQREAPYEAISWVKQAGLGRLRLPVDQGGAGVSLRDFFHTLIRLAEADSNVAHILRTHFWYVEQALLTVDPDARRRAAAIIASDRLVGNGFSEQTARPVGLQFETLLAPASDGDGFRLNGEKFYSTGTLYSDYTQIWASTPHGRIAGAVIPLDRPGLHVEDDWDGFGQRLTGTGTTRLVDVHVHEHEVVDLGSPDGEPEPTYEGAFLQLYLQAVTAGILRSVRQDAVTWVRRRRRNFSHATAPQQPTGDRQVLQVVGEISADAFAAEAIVLAAADAIQAAADSVAHSGVPGRPTPEAARAAQLAAAQAKVAVDRFAAATATRLFDVGGASATQSQHNLDRHWRNIRTVSTHNPTFLKASAIGDLEVNGTDFPGNAYF